MNCLRIFYVFLAAILIGESIPLRILAQEENRYVDIYASRASSYALRDDGTVWCWGGEHFVPVRIKAPFPTPSPSPSPSALLDSIPDVKDVVSVEDIGTFIVVLKNDGTVWYWLEDAQYHNQLAPKEPTQIQGLDHVISVSAYYTITTGSYHTWGGQSPLIVTRIVAVKEDGSVWKLDSGGLVQVYGLHHAVKASTGKDHTLILDRAGRVFAFGNNRGGKLGNGFSTTLQYPKKIAHVSGAVQVFADVGHTAVLTWDNKLYEWFSSDMVDQNLNVIPQSSMRCMNIPDVQNLSGINVTPTATELYDGETYQCIGKEGETTSASMTHYPNEPSNVIQVAQNRSERVGALGDRDVLAMLTENGTVWIKDYMDSEYHLIPGLNDIIAIDMTYHGLYALKRDGTVWNEKAAQLGGLTGILAISCGHTYSIALKNDGTVYQLDRFDHVTPIDNLSGIISVAAGGRTYRPKTSDDGTVNYYFAALQNDGSLWVWGDNTNGHLGVNSMPSETAQPVLDTNMIYKINDTSMIFEGVEYAVDEYRNTIPLLIDNRTFVPLRSFIETIGGSVTWVPEADKVHILYQDTSIELWINCNQYTVNGEIKTLDSAPQLIQARTMVPVRAIAEELGFQVDWSDFHEAVSISWDTF